MIEPTWQKDGVQLYLGDCLEILPQMESGSVDAVITDPPYDEKTHKGAILESPINFDSMKNISFFTSEVLRISLKWCISFCSLEMLGEYKKSIGDDCWVRAGIWDRISNMPQLSGDRPAQGAEGIAIFHSVGKKNWNGGGKAAMWRCLVERGCKEHPTQKPLALLLKLTTQFSNPHELILDPFMGSGTTGVACIKLNRKFIGIEKEPAYFETAVRRIEAALKDKEESLF